MEEYEEHLLKIEGLQVALAKAKERGDESAALSLEVEIEEAIRERETKRLNEAAWKYMRNGGAEKLREVDLQTFTFPYSSYLRCYGDPFTELHYQIPTESRLTTEQLEEVGLDQERYSAYIAAGTQIEGDALTLFRTVLDGGAPFFERYAGVDLESFLRSPGFNMNETQIEQLVKDLEEKKEGNRWAYGWAKDIEDSYLQALQEMKEESPQYKGPLLSSLRGLSNLYNLLHALCLLGYEKELRQILRPELPIRIRSHKGVNDLGRTSSKKQGYRSYPFQQSLLSKKEARLVIETGQTQIIFPELETPIQISAQTDRTLTALLGCLQEGDYYQRNEVTRAVTTIPSLMELYGQTSRKDLRKAIKEDLDALGQISLKLDDKGGAENYVALPLAGGAWGIGKKGEVFFSFSPDFMRLISGTESFALNIPPQLFKVKMGPHPHAWTIGKKLINHSNSNLGKPTESTLSVKALLDYVETLPKEDEIAEGARQYTKRIIEPMERDLTELVTLGVIDYWEYCHSKEEPLTEEEQAARLDAEGNATKPLPYEIAKGLYITWKLSNDFNREDRLERKKARRLQAAEAKAEKEKKNEERNKRRERYTDKILAEAEAKAILEGEKRG